MGVQICIRPFRDGEEYLPVEVQVVRAMPQMPRHSRRQDTHLNMPRTRGQSIVGKLLLAVERWLKDKYTDMNI